MNTKQNTVLILAILAIGSIVYFTPRYKITWTGKTDFIRTEQTSPLYKRAKGKENLHWDRIALYGGVAMVIAGILIATLRDKRG